MSEAELGKKISGSDQPSQMSREVERDAAEPDRSSVRGGIEPRNVLEKAVWNEDGR